MAARFKQAVEDALVAEPGVEAAAVEYPELAEEPYVGGVYVRLY